MISKFFFVTLTLILIFSCEKTHYTQNECELLSMEAYKGFPRAAHKFKKYCTNYKITYTHELCQQALTYLISTGDLTKVEVKYGDKIKGCFTENDLKQFMD